MTPILLIFHMDGCPHCPPALRAAKRVVGAHVLSAESKHPLVRELGVGSFPSIWLSLPNDLFEFQKPTRGASELNDWIAEKTRNLESP
jgi:hypothetical protein